MRYLFVQWAAFQKISTVSTELDW